MVEDILSEWRKSLALCARVGSEASFRGWASSLLLAGFDFEAPELIPVGHRNEKTKRDPPPILG